MCVGQAYGSGDGARALLGADAVRPDERRRRRDSFRRDAAAYDALRPEYPAELLSEAMALAGLRPGDPVLEVGCGTGQATEWLADQGLHVVAVDRAEEMLALAKARVADRVSVDVRLADFETMPVEPRYRALVLATSYHWLDPRDRMERCAGHLRPGGALILLWHVHPLPFTGFFEDVQPVYERLVPEWAPPRTPGMVEARLQQICDDLAAGPFVNVERRAVDWSRSYTTEEYLRLMSTYSDHALLDEVVRTELFEAVAALIDRSYGGTVTRPYRSELVVSRRRD
jgi:SAM-dependent methyltransferase